LLGMSLPTISFFYFIIVFLQSTQDTWKKGKNGKGMNESLWACVYAQPYGW
jgi:hypothetical protein